jgi:hypothetical protein
VDATLGAVLAVLDVPGLGLVGYRKHVPTFHPQPYGHGCVAEVFNAARYDYLELELHGPLVRLQPGTSFTLVEEARLFDIPAWPQNPATIQAYLGINE